MIQWKKLFVCIAIPLVVGGLSAALTKDSMELYETVQKPALTPPGWIFPVVWTILFVLMGIASYLILTTEKSKDTALRVYGLQLAVNFFWSILFFNLQQYQLSFFWLLLLWLLVFITTVLFYQISKPAGYLMLPYLLWVTFAGYLNFSISLLN